MRESTTEETGLSPGDVDAALCCLLKQLHMTSLCHLSLHTKTELVVAMARHYNGCASLLAGAEITHNKAGKSHKNLYSKSRCYRKTI